MSPRSRGGREQAAALLGDVQVDALRGAAGALSDRETGLGGSWDQKSNPCNCPQLSGEGAKPSLHGALALLGASASGNLSVETDVGSDKHLFL